MPVSPTATATATATTPTSSNQQARRASLQVLSRNIDRVVLGNLLFKAWYYSPYPDSVIVSGEQQQQQQDTNAKVNVDEADLGAVIGNTATMSKQQQQHHHHTRIPSSKTNINGSASRRSLDRTTASHANINTNTNTNIVNNATTIAATAANATATSMSHPSGTSCDCLYVCPYCFRYTPRATPYAQHLRLHRVTYNPHSQPQGDLEGHSGDNEGEDDGKDDSSTATQSSKTSGDTTSTSIEDRTVWPVPDTAVKVYEHNGYTVWDVDGEREKLYCQNLSLFGKLFLEQKSVFFDTGGFHYFVLTYTPPLPPAAAAAAASPPSTLSGTESARQSTGSTRAATAAGGRRPRTSSGSKSGTAVDVPVSTTTDPNAAVVVPSSDITALPLLRTQVLGFFSKENLSWDANNLACILIFPPYQHRNLGQLLMAVSYKLSGWEWEDSIIGGPEKPLSAMGRRSYLRFWSERVARFVMGQTADADGRRVFDDDDGDDDNYHNNLELGASGGGGGGGGKRKKLGLYHHHRHRREEMTIKEIGERTGMLAEDVVAALNEMGVIEVMPPKKKKRKSDGEDNNNGGGYPTKEDEELLASRLIHRSKVLDWIKERSVDLISPVKEEGFLGEWALSDIDDNDEGEQTDGQDEEDIENSG